MWRFQTLKYQHPEVLWPYFEKILYSIRNGPLLRLTATKSTYYGLLLLRPCLLGNGLTRSVKVSCRVQIWKNIFCQIRDKFGYICKYSLYLQKTHYCKPIKIDTLNFTMYILTTLTSPLQTCVTRLHTLSEEKKSAKNNEFFGSEKFFCQWRIFLPTLFLPTINFYRWIFLPTFFL